MTLEELRAELRECLFTPAERNALEAELIDLIRQRNEALAAEEEGISPSSYDLRYGVVRGRSSVQNILDGYGWRKSRRFDGLRPSRAGVSLTFNVPKPAILVSAPVTAASAIA